ncbi:MAG: UV DNA damage repair endonuclease UvsE [Gammaproteobacteria bacterium]|nr:UV DNA damage repair endonuclease UvsE [Gammaproteobacteria bacterium]
MIAKIGFACKIMNPTKTKEWIEDHNLKSTTVAFMNRNSRADQEKKLISLLKHNLRTFGNMLLFVSQMPVGMRMMRIGSDLLPLYTHPEFMWFYNLPSIKKMIDLKLGECGTFARNHNIRLSFHPGQFCILNSIKSDVVDKTIIELEYHTYCAEMMGYDGSKFHDHNFAINIHVGGKEGGTDGFVNNSRRLSQACKNFLTVENDEFSFGVDDVIKIADKFSIVLDIHHHLINSGDYIMPDDKRLDIIFGSWRGQRPKIHFSSSIDMLIEHVGATDLPDMKMLFENGFTKTKLRKHSDLCWNNALNEWALSFSPMADIMVEAKNKNLASQQLYDIQNKSI